jgi:competence protein ComGC
MNKNFLRQKEKGTALVYGLIIMTVVSIVLTSIITFVAGQTKYALQVHAREQAFQIAESGIQYYRWYLAHQVEGRTAQQVADFWDTGNPYGVATPYEADYYDPSGELIGRYRLEVTPPSGYSTAVTVLATGWTFRYPSNTRTIEVRFRKPAWSEHIVLANDTLRFGAGTEVYGKIHSNQGIRFDGVAHNIVSSAVSTYNDPDHTGGNEFGVHTHDSPTDPLPPAAVPDRPDVFEGGRSFPVASTDFNGVLGDLSYIKTVAQAGTNGSRYFDNVHQGRHIILNADDTFSIRTVQSFNASTNQINNYSGGWATYATPNDGVIFVENNVWLSGTVNGRRVTIVAANLISASQKSVYIGNDIRYTNYDCTDILGIIGQNDVEIFRASEDDLRIDGALIAQSGRVGRSHYQGGGGNLYKTTITIFGAMATNERYGFAWTDGTGYANRDLYFDNNLLYCPPPYFPTGTQYEMDLWEER